MLIKIEEERIINNLKFKTKKILRKAKKNEEEG
jgi:hypothetical protein